MPNLFDVIEVIVGIPEHKLDIGVRGTIVECLSDDVYEVEFINNHGETTSILPLRKNHFIIIWKSDTKEWVTLSEKVANLVANLPEDAGTEVYDFAKFLYLQRQKNSSQHIQ